MSRDILIETFFSLSKTLSFSGTARELGISQQAVSKNIARLEANLGFTLLNRNSHKVTLTTWGKRFLEANTEYNEKILEIKDLFQSDNNTVKLLTLNQPEFDLLRTIKPLFIPETDTEISIETSATQPDAWPLKLVDGTADFVVTLDRFIPETDLFCTFPIYSFEICILVSKDHPLYHEGVDYKVFRNEPFVAGTTLDNLFGASINFVQKDINAFDLDPSYIVMQTNAAGSNTKAAEDFVAQGSGIIVGASLFGDYADKNLVAVPTGKFNHIAGVWHKDSKKIYLKKVAEYIHACYEDAYKS